MRKHILFTTLILTLICSVIAFLNLFLITSGVLFCAACIVGGVLNEVMLK